MDDKYYTAVSYFGVEGVTFDRLILQDEKAGKVEEEKVSSLENLSLKAKSDFKDRFQTLLLKSNLNKIDDSSKIDITDFIELQKLHQENENEKFATELETKEISERPKFLFDHREQILAHLDEYIDSKTLSMRDIVLFFKYSIETMGISGDTMTKIMIKYMKKAPDQRDLFITQLRRIIEIGGSVFVDMASSDLSSLMNDNEFPEATTSNLLRIFDFPEQFYQYELAYRKDSQYGSTDKAMQLLLHLVVQKVNHHEFFDMEKFLRIYFEKFGYISHIADMVENTFTTIFQNYAEVLELFDKPF